MCSIENCSGIPIARGLCRKHYTRQRRHGDPERVYKPGSKLAPLEEVFVAQFREFSPRSRGRILQAYRLLVSFDAETCVQAVARATRPNGSLNVSKLLDMATMMAVQRDAEGS
jgi:hypothetical protein